MMNNTELSNENDQIMKDRNYLMINNTDLSNELIQD